MSLNFGKVEGIDGNKEDILKSVNTTMRDVDGLVKNFTFKPLFDSNGFLTGIEEVSKKVSNLDFKDFDAKAEKTSQLLRELGRQGQLSSDDMLTFNKRLDNLKVDKSVDGLEKLNNEIKELNKGMTHESKMFNSMSNINNQALDLAQNLGKINATDLNSNSIKGFLNELERFSNIKITNNKELEDANIEFKNLEKSIKSFVQESNRLATVDNQISKLQNTIEKLRTQGSLSNKQADGFLVNLSSIEKTTDAVKKLEIQIDKVSSSTTSSQKINNAISSVSPTIDRLNEKLDITLNKLGSNVNTESLNKIRNELTSISNMDIKSIADINQLGNAVSNVEKSITQLTVSANHMSRFESSFDKVKDALRDLERSGYSAEETIADFRNTLNNIPTGDLDKVKILLSQIDDEMDRINHQNGITKAISNANLEIGKLEAQLEKTKSLYARSFDRDVADQLNNRIVQLRENLNSISAKGLESITRADLDGVNNNIKQMSVGIKQFNADATTSVRNSIGVIDSLKVALEKFPVWMLASTIFYSTARGIRDLTEKVIELDSAMISLERVADGSQFEFDGAIERSIANVTELSGKLDEYLTLVTEYARTGKTIDESFDLANTTQMLTNISDLKAEESVNALTAAMIAFGIEAENSARIADKLNEVKC